MSDEQREKGLEERAQYAEPMRSRHNDDEPEVEGHLLVNSGTERAHDEVDRAKRAK